MIKGSQEIKCTVESCKFHDKDNFCTLEKIQVGNCEDEDAKEIKETACNSFKFYENK